MNAESIAIEPELDLSPGQTREQALKLRAIMDKQGKTGKATLKNFLAIIDENPPLWDTDEEFEEFMGILRELRKSRSTP